MRIIDQDEAMKYPDMHGRYHMVILLLQQGQSASGDQLLSSIFSSWEKIWKCYLVMMSRPLRLWTER